MSSQISQKQVPMLIGVPLPKLYTSDMGVTRIREYGRVQELDVRGLFDDIDCILSELDMAIRWMDPIDIELKYISKDLADRMVEAFNEIDYIEEILSTIYDIFEVALTPEEREEMRKTPAEYGYWIDVDRIPRRTLCKYIKRLQYAYETLKNVIDAIDSIYHYLDENPNDDDKIDMESFEEGLNELIRAYWDLEALYNVIRILDP